MILILGGTTEGRAAAAVLEEAGQPFFYATRGCEQQVDLHHGMRLSGGMDKAEISLFCRQHDIRLLLDAAHPFAQGVHENVAQVATQLHLPSIRYERIYSRPMGSDIVWCNDFSDMMDRVRRADLRRVLALTGVQTIAKLRDLWTDPNVDCHFRILDRDASRRLAQEQGFPADHLCYFDRGETTMQLLQRLQPQAILTKESGESGGFDDKIEAARQMGIPVFVVERPAVSPLFHVVDGPHGLRRAVEHLLPDFFPLRSGLTTGTCATAAALGALLRPHEGCVGVLLPDGETIRVDVEVGDDHRATVYKDSGDDPDVTNGTPICARVDFRAADGYQIEIEGGEGVGRVTLPGLGLPVGAAAINPSPCQMIRNNLLAALQRMGAPPGIYTVTISVPKGRRLAQRTFNGRVGVVDGISIIGTSGIIRPFSSDAFVASIRRTMQVAVASHAPIVVINSGAKSEGFLRSRFPQLPPQAFVHYGNFIGETVKIASELGVRHLALGLMIGKAVKLAEGNLNTHSHEATMNHAFLVQLAHEAGCRATTLEMIASLSLARQLWKALPADELPAFAHHLVRRCHSVCQPLLPGGELTVMLVDELGGIWM